MKEFIICTDNTADLPENYLRENNIPVVNLAYILNGKTYGKGEELKPKQFYQNVRNGSMPTTSQVNPEEGKEFLTGILKEGKDVLYIAFSSGLSGTYNSMRLAAEEISEEGNFGKIIVVDSLSASLGEGLLVFYAVEMKKAGKTMEEIADWVENHKKNLVHVFTVDDLFHLHRGGRVSKATAVLGTMVNIKPILHVDHEGHLIAIGKVRGRKKSLNSLVDYMDSHIGAYRGKQDIVFISHGDCEEDAQYVARLVEEKFGIGKFKINFVGPTIGAHSGPGTVALFFLGDER